jgi:RNA polymerase sigma-70 factor (ECF subfamily)
MNEEIKKRVGSPEGDAELVRAIQAGDIAAFDQLVLKHKDKSQETFIKVFKSLKKFRFESAFSTWLYRIAMNTCKNRLKSSAYRWKKKTVPLENPEGSNGGNFSSAIRNDSTSPVIELEKKERMMLIQKSINSLPEEQKRMVVLRDIQGLSYDEIADISGLNLGTVKSRLARGRLELRNKLKGKV